MFCALLQEILAAHPQFTVVGSAGTVTEALERLQTVTTDVVLVDLSLPDMSGFELIAQLKERKSRVKTLVCTAAAHDAAVTMAFAVGADGFAEKTTEIPEFLAMIERAADGVCSFSPRVSSVLRDSLHAGRRPATLQAGDVAVLRRLARHESPQEIARDLGLSVSGVYKVRQRIIRRTGANSKRELFELAVKLGVVPTTLAVDPAAGGAGRPPAPPDNGARKARQGLPGGG